MSTLLATEGYVDKKIASVTTKITSLIPGTAEPTLDTNPVNEDGTVNTSQPKTGTWKYSMYMVPENNGVRIVVWGYAASGTPRLLPLQQKVEETDLKSKIDFPYMGTHTKELVLGSNTFICFKNQTAKIFDATLNLVLGTNPKLRLFIKPNVEPDTVFNGCFVIEGIIPGAQMKGT